MSDIEQYNYALPRELIAQFPLAERADARLMTIDREQNTIHHGHVRDLPELLCEGDCLVLNDTRVLPAALRGRRDRTGGRWSGLFLRADEQGVWQVMSKTRGKLTPGETVTLEDANGVDRLTLAMLCPLSGGVWAAKPESDAAPLDLLDLVGRVPLPPYIRGGSMVDSDRETYQTVFAEQPGAIAAPTAGLHFTKPLLAEIQRHEVELQRVTLHVGVGTFRPVSVAKLEDHPMHSEWGAISDETARRLNARRAAGGRIVAVGTTAVRVLETASAAGKLAAWQGETDLFIRPPYEFRSVDALLTNFHLPRSTLLVLVRAFGGDALIRRAYEEAIAEQYRFYSYGDAMLIV